MCLAIPMVLVERNEFEGVAEIDGVQRRISVMYVPEAEVGDYVLVHAGFAIKGNSVEEGARTSVFLATSEAVAEVTGKYYDNCREKPCSAQGRDPALARALWQATEGALAAFL